MRSMKCTLGGTVLGLCLAGLPAPSEAAPATDHPRLWVTNRDLPRLRAWAADRTNKVYSEGLVPALQRAASAYETRFFPNGVANPVWPDQGTNGYVQYPSEAYAELFAFMSLIDPDPAARQVHAMRARNLLMYAIDAAAAGRAPRTAFRDPGFATGDRSRWWGEGFPLTVDWIYNARTASGAPILTAADKARIRQVFLTWARDNVNAATTANEHPQPIGVMNDPALLSNERQLRWTLNNYYLAHLRQITLLSLSMDGADDPPQDPRLDGGVLGNTLRSYTANATGAWLYQAFAVLETPETAAEALGVSTDGLGVGSGGLPVEGFLYGANLANLHEALLALHTAGYDDPAVAGPQIELLDSDYWNKFTDGFLHSLAPRPVVYPSLSYLGPVYEAANYGDTLRLWIDPRFADVFASIGAYDYMTGNTERLQKARWIVSHAIEGGAANLLSRTSRIWGTPSPTRAILTFLLFGTSDIAPADPRPSLPTTFIDSAPGRRHVLARTDWTPDARWFTYHCSWLSIDHQTGDCNQIEFYRKGAWLTKEHSSYSDNIIGMTSDYHNTLSIQNDVPSGLSWFETEISARGSQWILGGAAGDPSATASSGDGYVFAQGIATDLYNTRFNPWVPADNARDVLHASRSVVWVQPDHIVVYDRATSATENRFKRFNLTVPGAPLVTGRVATVPAAPGQQLFVQTLLPENAALRATPVENVMRAAAMEPTTHRLVVEDLDRPADVRFLHVLQGADSGDFMSPAVHITSSAGAHYDGAVVAGTAILFSKDLSETPGSLSYTVPGTTSMHIVTGLVPDASYDVESIADGDVSHVTITAGFDVMSDEAGVLMFHTR